MDACGSPVGLRCLIFEYLGYNLNDLGSLSAFLPVGPNGTQKQPDEELTITSPGPSIPVGILVNNGPCGNAHSTCTGVAPGGTFEVCGTWDTSTEIVLFSGNQSWSVGFHTSCAMALDVNDTYGSLRIVGINNTLECGTSTVSTLASTTMSVAPQLAQDFSVTVEFEGADINPGNVDEWDDAVRRIVQGRIRRSRREILESPDDLLDLEFDSSSVTMYLANQAAQFAIEEAVLQGTFVLWVDDVEYIGTLVGAPLQSTSDDSEGVNQAITTNVLSAVAVTTLVAAIAYVGWKYGRRATVVVATPMSDDSTASESPSSFRSQHLDEFSPFEWDNGGLASHADSVSVDTLGTPDLLV